jgi:hypothetical protein
MAPSAAMPASDIVRPEWMAIPAAVVATPVVAPAMVVIAMVVVAMVVVAVVVVAVMAPAVVIVVLREGRSGQQCHKSGSRQHRTESTKSHP